MRPINAVLLRHADVGAVLAAGMDADQRCERRDARVGDAAGRRDADVAARAIVVEHRRQVGRASRRVGADVKGGVNVAVDRTGITWIEVQQLAEERRVVVARLVVGEVGGEALDRLPSRGDATALAVIGVPADRALQRIFHRRTLMLVDAIDLERDVVELGKVDVHFAIAAVVVSDTAGNAAVELAAGRAGDEAQRAAFGVAAEQRALRTLEHLDPLDIEQRGVEALRLADGDAVDVDADARIARGLVLVVGHDAADADGQRRLARLERGDA